jgi:hypothetical protein
VRNRIHAPRKIPGIITGMRIRLARRIPAQIGIRGKRSNSPACSSVRVTGGDGEEARRYRKRQRRESSGQKADKEVKSERCKEEAVAVPGRVVVTWSVRDQVDPRFHRGQIRESDDDGDARATCHMPVLRLSRPGDK